MTLNIYTKWIIAAAFILLIVSTGCILYYQQTTQADKRAAEQADKLLQELKSEKTKPTITADKESTEPPTQRTISPAEKTNSPTTQHNKNPNIPTLLTMDVPLKEKSNSVSPHGFGEYPKLPEGVPVNPFTGDETLEMELLKRVAIKAWNNGERFEGASTNSLYDKIYLHYPNTIYVEYDEPIEEPNGTIRIPITNVLGTGDVRLTREQMDNGEIPTGINVLSLRDDGINPYSYLELQ